MSTDGDCFEVCQGHDVREHEGWPLVPSLRARVVARGVDPDSVACDDGACWCYEGARPLPVTAPEDDGPVGEVPPTWAGLFGIDPTFPAPDSDTDPRTWQALLTQLHEARAEVARLTIERDQWERMCRGSWRNEVHLAQRGQHHLDRAEVIDAEAARLRVGIAALSEHLVTRDGPCPGHDHLCPDGVADDLRALLDGEVRP